MDEFILQTVNNSISGKSDVATSCFYGEVFQGGFYDFHAKNKTLFLPDSGYDVVTATKTRNEIVYSYSIDRSDASLWTKFYPSSFNKNFAVGQAKTISFKLPYNKFSYNISTGVFTGSSPFAFNLCKGYLIRLYSGFFSDDYSAALYQDADGEHTIKQFTGVITSISNSETDGSIEITATDYSVLFLNQLNYNYPDIVSYRDALEDSDDVVIGTQTYKSPIRIQPANLFADVANQQFIPAYDNWKVIDAIRDLCIKINFPIERVIFNFINSDKQRLGKSEKYPFMKTQAKYVQTSSSAIQEMVKIGGIDTEALDNARYKFDFGKNIWDCITSICEDFGYKLFFDENGKLNIKDVSVGSFYQSFTGTEVQLIESYAYGWLIQDISSGKTAVTTNQFSSGYKIEARFVSKDEAIPSTVVSVYNGATKLKDITVRALSKYDAETMVVYEADSPLAYFTFTTSGTAYLNCLYYYTTEQQNIPLISLDTTKNVSISQSVISSDDVRNQVISIGKPKASEPLISKSIDFTSIYGGENVIDNIVYNNGTATVTEYKGDFFTNGKKDNYQKVNLYPNAMTINCNENSVSPKLFKIYLKQDASYIGKIIKVNDGTSTISRTINSNDITNQGMMFYLTPTKISDKYTITISSDINQLTDVYFSEFELFDDNISFNYIGFQKELMIVKDNVSDKSSNDWASESLIEIHRGNCHQAQAQSIGIPFLKVGDSVNVYAPELGFANDKIFYISSISESGTDISYTANLSLSAVPPTKSLQYIPDIDETKFTNDIYDFSVQIKEKDNVSGDAKGVIGTEFNKLTPLPNDMRKYKYGRMVAYDSVNSKLYVLGGSSIYCDYTFATRLNATKLFAVLDIATGVWTSGEMPTATCFGLCGFYDGNLYVINSTNQTNKVMKYTVSTGLWSEYHTIVNSAFHKHCGSGVFLNGKIYSIGGWHGSADGEYPLENSFIFDIEAKLETAMSALNSTYGYFLNQCVLSNDNLCIYNYGGAYRDFPEPGPGEYHWDWSERLYNSNNLKRYTISTNTWETLSSTNGLGAGALTIDSTNNIYAIGGKKGTGSGNALNNTIYRIYDGASDYSEQLIGGIQENLGIGYCKIGDDIAIVGESAYIIDLAKMKVNQSINIIPIDDYCLFSFALTKRRKISILVKHPTENKIFAWPFEEAIVEPGVYKRENGIRWDFGLDFEQRFGDYVDKIFLYPNDSDDNYVYSTIYENLEVINEYDPTIQHLKTPPFYVIRMNTKLDKYLLNTLGTETVSMDVQNELPIITHSDMYKNGAFSVAIEDVLPTQAQIGGSVVCPITAKRNNAVANPNDIIYIDVLVQTNDGLNVNQITQAKDEWGRYPTSAQRTIITASLIDEIKWDLTDSSGLYVPINTKYKFKIINAFGVNGEAVVFTTASGDNFLPNPTFSTTKETITDTTFSLGPGRKVVTQDIKTIKEWQMNSDFSSNILSYSPTKDYSVTVKKMVDSYDTNLRITRSSWQNITTLLAEKAFGYKIFADPETESMKINLFKCSTFDFDKSISSSDANNKFGYAMKDKDVYSATDIVKMFSYSTFCPWVCSNSVKILNFENATQDIYVSFEYNLASGQASSYINSTGDTEVTWSESIRDAIVSYSMSPVFFIAYKTDNGYYKVLTSDIIKLTESVGTKNVAGALFTLPKSAVSSEIELCAGALFGIPMLLKRTSTDPEGKPSGYVAGLFNADAELGTFVDNVKSVYFNPEIKMTFDNFQAIEGSSYQKIDYPTQPRDNKKTSGIFEVIG